MTMDLPTIRYFRGWKDPAQDRRPSPEIARIMNQDYEAIKTECLTKGYPWEDPVFPPTDQSLYLSGRDWKQVEWLRPKDICANPQMAVDGLTRYDAKQGELGNCWFLAAIASLCSTENKELFHQVVPQDNLFTKDYAGVFHFRLWQYGKWVDVVVDDQLPTVGGKLIFARSATEGEFWPALLEKAYAKVNSSYKALVSGNSAEAMQDFTGGVTETFDSEGGGFPNDLFTIMKKAFERDSLMGCSVDSKLSFGNPENQLRNGLVTGHAYSITSVKQITVRGRSVNLIRVRNPWADDVEWNGAWSDKSDEWKSLSSVEKTNLGLTFANDGEFWMSFDDFATNFSKVEMCLTLPNFDALSTSNNNIRKKIQWQMTPHEGSWKKGVNAGGCINHLKTTFWNNPQYKVQVVAADEDSDDNKGTLIIALLQKDRRKHNQELGSIMLSIGYHIFEISDTLMGSQHLNLGFTKPVESSLMFTYAREVVDRYKLSPGSYLIVPCTFKPNEEGDFLLRIFSEKPTTLTEIDEETKFFGRPEVQLTEIQDIGDKESDLKDLFRRTAGDDPEIDAHKLRKILESKLKAEFNVKSVNLETARSLLAMMDSDHSGKLGYDEFKLLWAGLRHWKRVFLQYDLNKTNSLDAFEMRAALSFSGFRLSNHTLSCLVMRYRDENYCIQFDDFLLCVARLKTMFDVFQPSIGEEVAPFSLDQIIQTTMYA